MHILDFRENGVKWRIACDKKAVGNKLESVDRSYYGMSPPAGGHLGIFWVGMCRPGLQNGAPFWKKFPLKLISRSRNGPIFYTPF